jgi:hypothetical protein
MASKDLMAGSSTHNHNSIPVRLVHQITGTQWLGCLFLGQRNAVSKQMSLFARLPPNSLLLYSEIFEKTINFFLMNKLWFFFVPHLNSDFSLVPFFSLVSFFLSRQVLKTYSYLM